jgi:hypothetical protein
MRKLWVVLLAVTMVALSAGCGQTGNSGEGQTGQNGQSGPSEQKDKMNQGGSKEPVTLKVYFLQPGFGEDDFHTKFEPLLTKKFPQYSYEMVV